MVGEGAAAAQDRAQSDHVRVQDAADGLRLAAAVASSAANEMDSSKKQALMAIGEAEAQGFLSAMTFRLAKPKELGGSLRRQPLERRRLKPSPRTFRRRPQR